MNTATFPAFVWSVGEEGSDPLVSRAGQDFRHDQYAQSGHYDHLEQDLRDIANLGVSVVRYGMPWRLAEPTAGSYNWALWDRALGAVHDAGLTPIIDLLHFGLPDHVGPFVETGWIDSFCRYADAFLARYREPMWFTPVNEPGITAMLTGRVGAWNDRLASQADHAKVLANIVLANLEVIARVAADRNGWWIGSEGFEAWVDPTGENNDFVERRQALNWLVWDLHLGLDPLPPAQRYLDSVDDRVRHRIEALKVGERVIAGHDFYPSSVRSRTLADNPRSIEEIIEIGLAELAAWYERYRVPFWIAETSNITLPVSDQERWLVTLSSGLGRLRRNDIPVRGLCWYSRGDQFDWNTMLVEPVGAVTEVGLFDAARTRRSSADVFARLAKSGTP
jgi:beta-glucosidase